MKRTLIAGIFCLLALNLFAQKSKEKQPEFGEITPEELAMKRYEKDTTAGAVILFDRGYGTITNDYTLKFQRHVRIKFFTQEEIDDFSNRTITYNTQGGSVSKLKGATYNMVNGKMEESKLNDDNVFRRKIDRYTTQLKFTLPNVQPGSIIEYSYVIGDADSFVLPPWKFQTTIPTIYSQYETDIPGAFTFRKDMQGFLPLSNAVNKTGYDKLVVTDAPAFKVEPFITTPDDYLSGINYFISDIYIPGRFITFERSWEDIAKNFYNDDDFTGVIKGNPWLNSVTEKAVGTAATHEEKVKAIHTFVKRSVEWDGETDIYPDDQLKKVLEQKKGSSSEINFLLIGMLKKAGLEAYPVLISTRTHGQIRSFAPHRRQFNDVICNVKIDGKERLLDATDPNLAFTSLPERCLNGNGFMINNERGTWVTLSTPKSRTVYTAAVKISEDGELAGNLTISRDGIHASGMRSAYKELGKEKYLAEIFEGKTWEIAKSEFRNIEEPSLAATEVHELVARDHVQAAGDVMYVNPYLAGLEENVFKSEKREYPVNMNCTFDRYYTARIEIPAGYKVEELPAQKMLMLPKAIGKFSYGATVVGNTINLTSQLTINQTLILADDYPVLREFYAQVVAKQAEQIVLKKAQ